MSGHKSTSALMAGSLLLSLLLALGHHFYYDHLDGRIVQNQNQQQWFLRAGTALAFLVRAFLSAAVGIAYTQILWRTLRLKSVTVRGVNSLFGVVHNAWDFTTWELWTAAPTLAVVAIIAWALPLVAVVTPATLTVQVSPLPNITVLDAPIPIPDYNLQDTFGEWTGMNGGGILVPSTFVSRLLLSVVSLGSILTLPVPFPNSSYALDFYGPSISCDAPKNESFAKQVDEVIKNATWSADPHVYVGFVPNLQGVFSGAQDEEYAINGLEYALNDSLVATASFLDETGGNISAAKFFVSVPDGYSRRANTTLQCELYNSSFALNFTFNNGQQDVKYKTKRINPVAAMNTKRCYDEDYNFCSAVHAYISIMGAVGQFLVGSMTKNHYGSLFSTQTQIRSSVLMDTREMQALNEVTPGPLNGNISMSNALEDLFTNMTISLFSSSRFMQNNTAASRGPVTYSSAQNEFSYEPRNLFIAYGTGLLLSAIIVIVGLLCIKSASASYESSFSTILRTTRNPELDTIVPSAETTGAEPLSKHLGNIRLVLRRQEDMSESEDSHAEKTTFFAVDSKSSDIKGDQTHYQVESLIPQDKTIAQTETSVESSTAVNQSPWERNEGRNLERSNYRQDESRD
ncbi:hypothetical protein FSPOR_5151 [Fusarium sporotrichioides]|uniref:Uncharacterized protein n=1 Tax=Fusarium sporotrichioides TaxID=5514 RepID=A0A395S8F3_FUSSP|nr:hypothetical protein FSPOR_5151 [Fusarium sporotrichioides]